MICVGISSSLLQKVSLVDFHLMKKCLLFPFLSFIIIVPRRPQNGYLDLPSCFVDVSYAHLESMSAVNNLGSG